MIQERNITTETKEVNAPRYSNSEAPAQVFLQPVAAPSILGLFGFAVAMMMVSTFRLGWYGSAVSPIFLYPFVAFFGGLAQFIAALWGFRARDGLAVAIHGLWGSFWMAYGLLYGMAAAGFIAIPTNHLFVELGMWFVGLAWVSWIAAYAAIGENVAMTAFLTVLAAGSTAAAFANFTGVVWVSDLAEWLFLISSVFAWYTASGLMLEATMGRSILPLGRTSHAEKAPKVSIGVGEPGVTHGQV